MLAAPSVGARSQPQDGLCEGGCGPDTSDLHLLLLRLDHDDAPPETGRVDRGIYGRALLRYLGTTEKETNHHSRTFDGCAGSNAVTDHDAHSDRRPRIHAASPHRMGMDRRIGVGRSFLLSPRSRVGPRRLSRPVRGGLATRCRACLLYTSPSPRDVEESRMPSSA